MNERFKLAGKLLREFREKQKLSLFEASDKMRISKSLLCFIEQGKQDLGNKLKIELIKELYSINNFDYNKLRILYGLNTNLEQNKDSFKIFQDIFDYWEDYPELYSIEDLKNIVNEGMYIFFNMDCELNNFLSRLYLKKKEYPKAKNLIEKSIKNYTENSLVYLESLLNNKGQIYFEEGQVLEVERNKYILDLQNLHLNERKKIHKLESEISSITEKILSLYEIAKESFLEALKINEKYERGILQLALIYYNIANLSNKSEQKSFYFKESIKKFEDLKNNRNYINLKKDPLKVYKKEASLWQSLAYSKLGEFERAKQLIQTIINENDSAFAYYVKSIIYSISGTDLEDGIEALKTSIQIDKTFYENFSSETELYNIKMFYETEGKSLSEFLKSHIM